MESKIIFIFNIFIKIKNVINNKYQNIKKYLTFLIILKQYN